ncbi:lipase maturation factor 2 isoform X2 [Elephas maximus indicus]|uniref:lipase maturation factor 2 isoform X2 n=1 Tax=Elephas maximus indicus TaxID=99487 RepID=UPI00211708A1|nr:lipase maturation factor 2 isoform X2 [Elephas maximus indicus]
MAASRLPRQLFLQGVAAVFMFAFASLYKQIPGLYGAEGILPARRMLRPQGKGRWQQLWEMPTLLWEVPRLGLDTAQGLELLSLLGTLLAVGAVLLRPLRHRLTYLLLWAAYLSACQGFPASGDWLPGCAGGPAEAAPGSQAGLPGQADGSCAPRRPPLLASALAAVPAHVRFGCGQADQPLPRMVGAHRPHIPLRDTVPAHTRCLVRPPPACLAAQAQRGSYLPHRDCSATSVLLPTPPPALGSLLLPGNYNFFNLLTLVLCTALLDDKHLGVERDRSRRKKMPASWPRALLTMLALLLELAVYGLLAYGTAHYFSLEVDWEQRTIHSRTNFTFHQFSQWLKTVTLPTMWLGGASLAWELLAALWRWTQVRGWLWKLWSAVQLSVFGTATVALFTVSLVPYSYMEPGTHGRLWTGAHRLFGAVEHLQLANSYGLFRQMTGLGGRPEVVLEGSYDGNHWTEIEFMYKPGNMSRPPPIVAPHQPRLDWQMWFAALGPHTHSPWFTGLVLRLLQGQEPVIRLIQDDLTRYPFHKQPPTYIRAQRYKYWFSQPGEQGRWWRRQWVEQFFPPVALGDPTLDTLLTQFGLQDRSPPRPRSTSSSLPQALHWVRTQLSSVGAPALLWGLLVAIGAIRVVQGLLSAHSPPTSREEKHRTASKKEPGAASEQANPTPDSCSSGARTPRRKK